MIALAIAGLVLVIAGAVMRCAPLGWEDRNGFHLGQPIAPIHTPSQLTHRQPGSISERSGKGDEAAFHEKGNDQ